VRNATNEKTLKTKIWIGEFFLRTIGVPPKPAPYGMNDQEHNEKG